MRRFWAVLALVLIVAFYVGWPAWSGYQIHDAIQARDAATLERKIDFPRVRLSLREPATQRISELYDRFVPGFAAPAGRMKQELMPRIVETSLAAVVTPQNLIRAAHERGKLKDFVDRTLGDYLISTGGIPGAGGTPGQGVVGKLNQLAGKGIGTAKGPVVRTVPVGGAAAPSDAEPSYGLDNIKRFAMRGPFRFEIGVAKDAAAPDPDATVEMSFTGLDWKLTAVKPRL